jgi:hypothetical protein
VAARNDFLNLHFAVWTVVTITHRYSAIATAGMTGKAMRDAMAEYTPESLVKKIGAALRELGFPSLTRPLRPRRFEAEVPP